MKESQLKRLIDVMNREAPKPVVSAGMLKNRKERTLLYGYDTERNTWHTFLRDGMLEHVIYTPSSMRGVTILFRGRAFHFTAEMIVPNKRLYPEACDAEFCELLIEQGETLPFTNFNRDRPEQQFHGYVPEVVA